MRKPLKVGNQRLNHYSIERKLRYLLDDTLYDSEADLLLRSKVESLEYENLVLSDQLNKSSITIDKLITLHNDKNCEIQFIMDDFLQLLTNIEATPKDSRDYSLFKESLLCSLRKINHLLLKTEEQLSLLHLPNDL